MPYPQFDRSKLRLLPLEQRINDVDLSEVLLDPVLPPLVFSHPALPVLGEAMVEARRTYDAAVLLMYGAHVIRTGNAAYMIELMERGLVTHFATNGAGSIHDFEFALMGHTCESVAKYIREGHLGLWNETGLINDIIVQAARQGTGWGDGLACYLWLEELPQRDPCVLATG